MKTQVGIIGGGPAGLLLAQLLHRQGIRSVVLENRPRQRVESRQRAGLLEQGTVDLLRRAGAAHRLDVQGPVHEGVLLSYNGQRHRIDLNKLTGGSQVTIYAQTEVVKDLIAYTATCMRRVWRVQEFSNFVTDMLHYNKDKSPFDQALQQSRFNQLVSRSDASALVARNYVGLAGKHA